LCLFASLAGWLFMTTIFIEGEPVTMRPLFDTLMGRGILIAVASAISMRLLSEELNSGTIETLLTSPISDAEVVIGKWVGAIGFYATLLATTFLEMILLAAWGEPDYGPIFTGYLGLLLSGGLFLAVGVFASAMTRNQIIAFLVTLTILLCLSLLPPFVASVLPASRLTTILAYINVNLQYADFSKGLIDLSHFIYFLSGIGFFLVLAIKVLESRKWR
jgi:ABC-2 type transport system permease protein